jgi:iron complex outermembrane receptor protein
VIGQIPATQPLPRHVLAAATMFVTSLYCSTGAAQTADAELAVQTVRVKASGNKSALSEKVSNGALGTRSELDTPFSIKTVTNEQLQERQVVTLGDVFKYDSSAVQSGSSYNGITSSISVRGGGIDQLNGYKIDGLSIPNWKTDYPIPLFEQVQLLKGASGFLYGFGAPGGVINYITKRPSEKTTFSADIGYKSSNIYSESIDAGGRLGEDGRYGYRVNAYHEEGGIYNGGSVLHNAASVALDARLTSDLKLTLDGFYQKRKNSDIICCVILANNISVPRPVDSSRKLGSDGSKYEFENKVVTTGLEWKISPDWKGNFTYRHAEQDRAQQNTVLLVLDTSGTYADLFSADLRSNKSEQWQAQLEGTASIAGLKNQFVLGASIQEVRQYLDRNNSTRPFGVGNLYQINTLTVPPYTADPYLYAKYTQNAVFASDTISFSPKWSLLAGLRYTDYTQDNYSLAGSLEQSYKKKPVSPTLALMFKPEPSTTAYASSVDSLESSAGAPSTVTNRFDAFGPLKSRQYELGIKTEQPKWSATAALFRIRKEAEYTDLNNTFVQNGEQVLQGLELGASLSPTARWAITGSLSYLDARYEKALAQIEGKRLESRPRWVAATEVQYRVPELPGLNISAGAKYTGASYANSINTQYLANYTSYEAGASYSTRISGRATIVRATIKNLSDKKYWSGIYQSTYVTPGEPRTFSLSVHVDL